MFVDSVIADDDVDIDVLGDVTRGAVINATEVLAVGAATSVVSLLVADDIGADVLGSVIAVRVVGGMAVIGVGAPTVVHALAARGSKYASGSQLRYKLTLFGVNI